VLAEDAGAGWTIEWLTEERPGPGSLPQGSESRLTGFDL
jgi:hypothetical protein